MKTRFAQIIFTLCLVAMFALTLTPTNTAQADNGKREDGAGKYAQWTALWWQWILEQRQVTQSLTPPGLMPQKGNLGRMSFYWQARLGAQ